MKILALDFGESRIGVARGDTRAGIAFPVGIIDIRHLNKEQVFEEVASLCTTHNIEKIMVGHPDALTHKESKQAEISRDFADDLEDFFLKSQKNIFVEMVEESFSSQIAARTLRSMGTTDMRKKKDALAAAVFLQRYFDLPAK